MYLNELFEIAKVHHHPRDRINLTTTTDAHLPFNQQFASYIWQ